MFKFLKRKKKQEKELAKVISCCGKLCLMVAGNVVAVEATQCWDGNLAIIAEPRNCQFGGWNWNEKALQKVADEINKLHITTEKGE